MDKKKIGERLRKAREDLGQSRRHVSRKTGIPYRTLCSFEYAQRVPRDDKKAILAHYYNTSVDRLFYADENNETC